MRAEDIIDERKDIGTDKAIGYTAISASLYSSGARIENTSGDIERERSVSAEKRKKSRLMTVLTVSTAPCISFL